jgi:hypothetical protein
MTTLTRSNRALLTGLGLSLAIHLSALLGVGRMPLVSALASAVGLPDAPNPADPATPLPAEEVPLVLGIADSDAVTVNWIGFEDPTEHLAAAGPTDQPELSMDPGAAADPALAAPTPESPAPAPETPANPSPEPGGTDPTQVADVAELDELLANLRPVMDQLLQLASSALAGAPPSPPADPQPQTSSSSDQGAGEPGEASDRESDPTAIIGTIDVRPGHPAAAKGLEIKTVRPNWPNLIRMTARPNNPLVIVKFHRSGQVFEANFEPGETTGSQSVDGPLLDAIYAWRASGEALRRLPTSDPAATLQVRIRVILR